MAANSGMLAERLSAVELGSRTGGLSSPFSSICVRKSWVYTVFCLEENTIQRPLGEKLCQEFMRAVLQRIRRGGPPSAGAIHSLLSGRISRPLRACTHTMNLPSGVTLAKLLLMPLAEAPAMGTAFPPFPPLKGMRYRSYWMGVSSGSLARLG